MEQSAYTKLTVAQLANKFPNVHYSVTFGYVAGLSGLGFCSHYTPTADRDPFTTQQKKSCRKLNACSLIAGQNNGKHNEVS
jgi:hypothetical protein